MGAFWTVAIGALLVLLWIRFIRPLLYDESSPLAEGANNSEGDTDPGDSAAARAPSHALHAAQARPKPLVLSRHPLAGKTKTEKAVIVVLFVVAMLILLGGLCIGYLYLLLEYG